MTGNEKKNCNRKIGHKIHVSNHPRKVRKFAYFDQFKIKIRKDTTE